jgi:hypothetical protein
VRQHGREEGFEIGRVELDRDIVIVSLIVVVMFLGVLAALTLYQQSKIGDQQHQLDRATRAVTNNQFRLQTQQRQLTYLEKRDRASSYQAAYRFCTRIDIDRAAIQWFVSLSSNKQARQILNRLRRRDGLPVLNCVPNVIGNPAAYWSPAKQHKFVRRWAKHMLTPPEIGICRIEIGILDNPKRCLK